MRRRYAETDYNESNLPQNRYQLFKEIYGNHFNKLFKCFLVFFLFAIPTIIVLTFNNIKVYEINLSYELGNIELKEALESTFNTINTFNIILIVALLILSIGVSGIIKVYRQMLFDEPVFFWNDFGKGVKQNLAHISIHFLIGGILNFLINYVFRMSYFTESKGNKIAIIFVLIALFIYLLVTPLFITQTSLYNLSLFHKFTNSISISAQKIHHILILVIITVGLFALFLINNQYFYLIYLIIFVLFLMPMMLFIYMLVSDSLLDVYINKDNYPQIYRKGLR